MALTLSVPQIPAVVLGTSATVVYQVPNTSGFFFVVKGLILVNTTASAVDITLYRAPTAGTVTDATAFVKNQPLSPKQALFIDTPITLAQNESIRGLCSAASSVTATLSGFGKVT